MSTDPAVGLTATELRLDESELVGSLISFPDRRHLIRGEVRSRDFEDPALQRVFHVAMRVENLTLQSLAQGLTKKSNPPQGHPSWAGFLSEVEDIGTHLGEAQTIARARAVRLRGHERLCRSALIRAGEAGARGDGILEAVESTLQDLEDLRRCAPRKAQQTLRIVTAQELLGMQIPPREYLLGPIFRAKDLAMIVAERGIGKSWVAQGIAAALASGGRFLRWEAKEAKRVLLVDGELPIETIQERVRMVCEADDLSPEDRLLILARDLQDPGRMPNLATPEGQAILERHIDGMDAVILDNVSSLFTGGDENAAGDWELAQGFLLRIRQRGLLGIYVHHAGRSGLPRGTSKREDSLDTIIELKHPKDYSPTQGVRFELRYTKSRGAFGADVSPFEARLEADPTRGGLPVWTMRSVEDAIYEKVIELFLRGMTNQREIAQEVGRDKSRVTRLLSRARSEGRIP